jgi:hypothetical protein
MTDNQISGIVFIVFLAIIVGGGWLEARMKRSPRCPTCKAERPGDERVARGEDCQFCFQERVRRMTRI